MYKEKKRKESTKTQKRSQRFDTCGGNEGLGRLLLERSGITQMSQLVRVEHLGQLWDTRVRVKKQPTGRETKEGESSQAELRLTGLTELLVPGIGKPEMCWPMLTGRE